MDIIKNNNLDYSLIVTNKSENHRGYIELLYESKKRTGGDEINSITYDTVLRQFLITFKNQQTLDDVLAFGDVVFENELYQAFKIDRTKFVIENIDPNLRNDVINLYIDFLLDPKQNCQVNLQHLRPGFVLVEYCQAIDFDSLSKKYSNHATLQNKTVKIHYVPELDKDSNAINRVDRVKYFSNIVNSCSQLNCVNSENNGQQLQDTLSATELFYREKIKNLEHKLLLYKNRINSMCDQRNDGPDSNPASSSLFTEENNSASLFVRESNLVPKECKLVYQDSKNCNTDLAQNQPEKMKNSVQKCLFEDSKNEDTSPTAKVMSRNKVTKSECTFSPLRPKCSPLAQRFPVIKYQRPKCKSYFKPEEETGENSDLDTCLNLNIKCSICLEDLLPDENVKILSCFHQFHVKCIDTWLAQKSTCPTCKLDLVTSSSE